MVLFRFFGADTSNLTVIDYILPNKYTLCSVISGLPPGRPQTVAFATQNDSPTPDPRYLTLHAVCVNITLLSGAGQHIDDVDRDINTALVLANDAGCWQRL